MPHRGKVDRDTARCRASVWSREMEENSAAQATNTRSDIVVQNEHNVVDAICQPHMLMLVANRRKCVPIVRKGLSIVAPGVQRRQGTHWDLGYNLRNAI